MGKMILSEDRRGTLSKSVKGGKIKMGPKPKKSE